MFIYLFYRRKAVGTVAAAAVFAAAAVVAAAAFVAAATVFAAAFVLKVYEFLFEIPFGRICYYFV